MARRLELPSSISAQQTLLLEKLPDWDASQLEKKLKSLEKKRIVVLTYVNPNDRRIYLERLSAIPVLDDKEKVLWLRLRSLVSAVS